MKRRPAASQRGRPARSAGKGGTGDLFVVVAMAIVSVALSTALHLQMGVEINLAFAIGAVFYGLVLCSHVVKRRRGKPARTTLRDEDQDPSFEAFEAVHDRLSQEAGPPPMPGGSRSLELEHGGAHRPRLKVAQVSLPPLAPHVDAGAAPAARSQQRPAAQPAAPSLSVPAAAKPFEPQALPKVPPPPPASQTGGQDGSSLDMDVERIQALVKKLASEVGDTPAKPAKARPPRLPAEAAVDASVGALRQTVDGMRAASKSPPPAPPKPGSKGAPPPLSKAQSKIAAVADSLVAGRVDVELEPIISLVDQHNSHYEVAVSVHGANGERLVDNAGFDGLKGTGLLPLFDGARLNRSVSIAQRLQERSKKGRVFSSYNGESLTNPSFMSDARSALKDRPGIGAQLVFGFQQGGIDVFTSSDWAAIAELRQLHAVFSIEQMSHLDIDLKQLVSSGFMFSKVPCARFLEGLRFGGRPVQGKELVKYITGAGMTLIIDQIDNEQQVQALAHCGVQLGQGKVFGGRRAVKLAATPKAGHAA